MDKGDFNMLSIVQCQTSGNVGAQARLAQPVPSTGVCCVGVGVSLDHV